MTAIPNGVWKSPVPFSTFAQMRDGVCSISSCRINVKARLLDRDAGYHPIPVDKRAPHRQPGCFYADGHHAAELAAARIANTRPCGNACSNGCTAIPADPPCQRRLVCFFFLSFSLFYRPFLSFHFQLFLYLVISSISNRMPSSYTIEQSSTYFDKEAFV